MPEYAIRKADASLCIIWYSCTMSLYIPAVYAILILAFTGIASGKIPRLAMNRASIALTAAILLIVFHGISADEAFAAIDIETIALLLAMMIIVANVRISGFFTVAGSKILAIAQTPRAFLAMVVFLSGFLSAIFLNDTICIMLTPLVAEIALLSKRDGRPYLIALAVSANAGSCATIIGNPQNMLIASQSGISFFTFFLYLAPSSIFAMLLAYYATILVFPEEFLKAGTARLHYGQTVVTHEQADNVMIDKALIAKSLLSSLLLLVLLSLGVRTSIAALVAASILLVTRRIHPERVFLEVDFTLLVFFSGLFILTSTVARTPVFKNFLTDVLPMLHRPGGFFAAVILILSNIVSNVPAVMLLSPVAKNFTDPTTAWLMLAMASTFAGNLTLLGSVANLIVAEQAKKSSITISFMDYFKVGFPVTIISSALGVVWLGLVR